MKGWTVQGTGGKSHVSGEMPSWIAFQFSNILGEGFDKLRPPILKDIDQRTLSSTHKKTHPSVHSGDSDVRRSPSDWTRRGTVA